MPECFLTYQGKSLRQNEGEPNRYDVVGALDDMVDERIHFTRTQVVDALCAQAILLMQTGGIDTDNKIVTSDIELLLDGHHLVKTPEGRQKLYIDKPSS